MNVKMSKLSALIFLCCLVYTRAYEQSTPSSLLLAANSAPDTASINATLRRTHERREKNPDSVIQVYQSLLKTCIEADYAAGIANTMLGLSRVYSIVSDYKKACSYAYKALHYCSNNTEGYELEANVYLTLAQTHYYQGKYDSCAWYRYKTLNLVESGRINDIHTQMKAYGGVLQFWMNAHGDIAHDKYIQQIMQHVNGIEQKALMLKDSSVLVNIYFQKEAYYENMRMRDSSRYYCQLTVDLGRRLKVTPSILVASLLNMAISYLEEQQPQKAFKVINEAIAEIPEQGKGSNRYFIFSHFAMGDALLQQKKYTAAINILQAAIAKADSLHVLPLTDYAHKTLAKTYDAINDPVKAAEQWRLYALVSDSLLKDKKMELVYNVEMKYRIADKDRELAQKELSIARNEARLRTKNLWIGGISTGMLLLVLLGLLLYRNTKHKHKLQAEKIRNLHQEVQIASLQAMISGEEKERSRIARELHDGMGGSLATIRTRLSSVFRKQQATPEISEEFAEIMLLLEEASAELRKTAHNLMPEILLQEGLAKASLLFCERIRKGHLLEVNTEIWGEPKNLPTNVELTAYRIIQELVQNILKHARATQALVQIVFHDSLLCITVEDNGAGMPAGNNGSDGVGLKTIRERVISLNGQMDIASSPGNGTSVYIELNTINSNSTQNVSE
ncbi:tetratricopeptide repeat-containing sensor histidine kinase [Filimonas effusa]|uniref:Oxygen sensor histidine kinase NreB n=1 Tax=Filimonas effusa TaxID=2508721 RepID=A0A4Q1DC66_9BACT|nr:ATP-binding protein [Filimonas effusa]RXK86538.1 two-component sensor histidine kinase [Filimonas effusa]